DPFDPETAYLGTLHGVYVTHQLRSGGLSDWKPLEGLPRSLAVRDLRACPIHAGHLMASTRLDLDAINYGADGPESAIIERWDAGSSWRRLFTGKSAGQTEGLALDRATPDALWIVWSDSLHRLERSSGKVQPAGGQHGDPGPPISEVLLAALR